MSGIKSESGFDIVSFIGTLFGAYVAMCVVNMALIGCGLYPFGELAGIPGLIAFSAVGRLGLLLLNLAGTLALAGLRRIANAASELLAITLNALNRLAANLTDLARAGLMALLRLALAPFAYAWGSFHAWAIAPHAERFRQWRELRALYAQVRDQFASFEEFRRAFEGGGEQQQQEQPAPEEDRFTKACRLLGLPEDGSFTQAQFKTRYRERMKTAHPDANGSSALAAELNQARDLIKSRKGWK
jgi:hypothetical protein